MTKSYNEYEALGGAEGIDEYLDYLADQSAFDSERDFYGYDAEQEAFEKWEMDRGCYLDPQSGYNI